VSLSFDALQVLDLVPYQQQDPADAFGVENGYVAETPADAFTGKKDAALTPSQQLRQRAAAIPDDEDEDEEAPF
jgi:hypothetical protein